MPAQHLHVAGLGAGLHVELVVAVERRDGERAAERRLRHGQVERREDVVPVAHEPLVAADAHEDVEVAGAPAEHARVPLAGEADALAVVDPGRDLDLDRALRRSRGRRPRRPGTGCVIVWPEPPHVPQACVRMNWPKGEFETAWSRPEPPQVGQVSGVVPGSAPVPSQTSQGSDTGYGDLARDALGRLDQLDLGLDQDVAAVRRAAWPPAPKMSSPKSAEKMSPRLVKSKVVGRKPPLRSPSWPKRSYCWRVSGFESTS